MNPNTDVMPNLAEAQSAPSITPFNNPLNIPADEQQLQAETPILPPTQDNVPYTQPNEPYIQEPQPASDIEVDRQQLQQNLEQNTGENPIDFIRENTPSNENMPAQQSQIPIDVVESDSKERPEQGEDLTTMKELLAALLDNQKIRDFSDFPPEMTKPGFYTAESSGREMIKPFGIDRIRFGLDQFSEALKNSVPLDGDTYILKYVSGRKTSDGKDTKPKFLKCTREQVEKWTKEVQGRDQTSQTQIPDTNYFSG